MISFQPFSGSQNTSGRTCLSEFKSVHSRRTSVIRPLAAIAATRSASRRSTARSGAVIVKSWGVKPVATFPAAVWSKPVDGPLP